MENKKISVAPMMEWTDRHCRYFLRLISRHIQLYSEMITSAAIIHGDRQRLLGFHEAEHPLALQLGGNDPWELAEAARIGADFGYDEINLNIGCPSDRVQSGRFGAALMAEPDLVHACVTSLCAAVTLPVTVKCRIGIDDQDGEASLDHFVESVASAGAKTLIVHARKAWLKGVSPKDNRSLPPLQYQRVIRLKQSFPELTVILNGGICSMADIRGHLRTLDGVMLGRAAYQNPYMLAEIDRAFFNDPKAPQSRAEILARLLPYVETQVNKNVRLHQITRHILGICQGVPGGRAWRRHLSENASKAETPKQAVRLIREAFAFVEDAQAMEQIEC